MLRRIVYILLIFSMSLSCCRVGNTRRKFSGQEKIVRVELPSVTHDEQVIDHIGYTTSYNSNTLNPNWVAYELTSWELQGESTGKNSFCWDPLVKGRKSNREDYKNNLDWDKGHMAPKADMKWSIQAYEESFYLSNICPQNHQLNAGDWLKTENLARRIAEEYKKIYIVCGPVFKDRKFGTLGENNVWIPDGFFKALLVFSGTTYESIGFYMSNEPQKNNLRTYVTTVDDIEKLISRDLFISLEDKLEDVVEGRVNYSFWGI